MNARRARHFADGPALEALESRTLLDATGLSEASVTDMPGLIVEPAIELEAFGAHTNDEMASAEELAFHYLLPTASALWGWPPSSDTWSW